MHREASPREVPRFELFFNLLYVAIIHQLGTCVYTWPSRKLRVPAVTSEDLALLHALTHSRVCD